MKQVIAKVTENRKITPRHYAMRVAAPYLGRTAKPGQFVEVRCGGGSGPLLRRPLGVHRIHAGGIELLYEVVGKGTGILAGKRAGEAIDIIGPLGNGFTAGRGASILVAGGIGVAPLLALAEGLAAGKGKRDIHVLLGARTKSHIVCESAFKKAGCRVSVATDDGSKGRKGFVTDALKDLLRAADAPGIQMYACGPTAMLKAVAAIAKEKGVACQVSLEERMACGVGVCLGCPVKVRKDLVDTEYRMVCKDGPVFDAEQIVW